MREVDFLIVGQGLAGTTLALELLMRGKSVLVLSDPESPCASRVAAGLYNPVTGKQLTKTWRADALFLHLESYYQSLEKLLKASFLHPVGIYRPFTSPDEQNDWMARSAEPAFTDFIERVGLQPHACQRINDPFGGVYLKNAGFVDTNKLLEAAKKYLSARGCLSEELFLEDNLSDDPGRIVYGEIRADKLVMCNGIAAADGRLFSWLPFHPLKGEILHVKTNLTENTVFNRGCFMLPATGDYWKVGSTYNWRKPDYLPSTEGRQEIADKLNHLYKGDVEIVDQYAGVRPSTRDRRPMLGVHPTRPNVYIFNGLGTKGVSLAPYFASQMSDFLTEAKTLNREVSIERFFSLYFEGNVG